MSCARQSLILCVVLFLLASISVGSALKCFECIELDGSSADCGDPFNKTSPTVIKCQKPEVCVKHVTPFLNNFLPETTNRGCAAEDYCEVAKELAQYCSFCRKDFCNSASSRFHSFTVFLLLVKYGFVTHKNVNIL